MEEITAPERGAAQSEPRIEGNGQPAHQPAAQQSPAAPDTLEREGVLFVTLAEAARRRTPPVTRQQMSDLLRRGQLPDPQDFKQGGKVYVRWGSVEEYEQNKPVGGRPTRPAQQEEAPVEAEQPFDPLKNVGPFV